jgi:glycosyltransferase involved in cell wall biosynthesis
MKSQLVDDFEVADGKVSVIPLGINNTIPVSNLTTAEARRRLGIGADERVLLFFGRIAPYKGLEYLIAALAEITTANGNYRLIIAGSIMDCAEYWNQIQHKISTRGLRERIIERIEFIPDDETEVYFKAADVLILPYVHIFQSGVLVLAYSFGLPVIAADVGSLREDILEGSTGYVCRPQDPTDLAKTIGIYFSSALFRELEHRRREIREYGNDRYSWSKVGEITKRVYKSLLQGHESLGSTSDGS